MKPHRYLCLPDLKSEYRGYILLGIVYFFTAWGCASTSQKLNIEEIPQAFEEGTIISAKTGMPIPFEALVADLAGVRIIYVGEQHTHAAHHQIQLDVIRALYRNNPNLTVGMEMFDHTYQDILDLWSAGKLGQNNFLEKVHWYANWRYDFGLYKDILEFIKEKKIRLIALNLPPHIPPKIRAGGIDNLSSKEKKHLPDKIDTSNAAHRSYIQEVYDHHPVRVKGNFEYFYMTQCVWEDTMAEAIARNLNDNMMVVLAGNGHIIRKFGIPDRTYQRTKVSFRTIYPAAVGSTINLSYGDYIWVTPGNARK